jgi:hypothetical protein
MPLQLSGQDIETPPGDSGTYTWADVVALGSTNLTTHAATSGESFYRWIGAITMRGTSRLNITNIALELLGVGTSAPGAITAVDSALVVFGQKNTIGSGTVYENGCNITISRTFSDGAGGQMQYAPLAYSASNRSSTTARINIYGSTVNYRAAGSPDRIMVFLSAVEGCKVYCSESTYTTGLGGSKIIHYMQSGGFIVDSNFNNISTEFAGPTTVSSSKFIRAQRTFLNWAGSRITLRNVAAIEPREDNYFNGDRNSVFSFVDSAVDISRGSFYDSGGSLQNESVSSIFLRVVDSVTTGNVQDALVSYAGRTTASVATSSGGTVNFELITRETTGSGTSSPIATTDHSAYTFSIKSYLHKEVLRAETVNNTVGAPAIPSVLNITPDAGVTQANTSTVSGYSGVSHTAGAFALSGPLTLSQVYDSRKLYWRNNAGVSCPVQEGFAANFGTANITLPAPANNPAITAKYTSATTSGTLTLSAQGDYSTTPWVAGSTVTVAPGSTRLAGWTLTGSTINVSSGSATVFVSSTAGITAGSNVTILQQSTLTLTGFPNGSRVVVSQSGRTQDLVNGQNPPYVFTGPAGGYGVVISAAGYKDLVFSVDLSTSQSIPVSLVLATSSQQVDQALSRFIQFMRSDTRYSTMLTEALAVSGLRDEAYTVRLGLWSSAEFKSAWNALIAHASITDPTSGEVAIWTGYLSQAGYMGISFTVSGGID